jgi:hypothetical protein
VARPFLGPNPFTDREMFLYPGFRQQRKEVIQCLIPSAVTSLRPPARLIASLHKGALGARTSETTKEGRAGAFGAPFLHGSPYLSAWIYLANEGLIAAPAITILVRSLCPEYQRCRIRHGTLPAEWPNAVAGRRWMMGSSANILRSRVKRPGERRAPSSIDFRSKLI